MSIDQKLKNCFIMTIYGDALGFAYENNPVDGFELKPFKHELREGLTLNQPLGQWSDLTELLLIQTKSLRDIKENNRVTVDYLRLADELRYWLYYRHGSPQQIIAKVKEGEAFQKSGIYWQDRRGYGLSRILSIILANKNNSSGIQELYKQILFLNRHPQVLITALLFARLVNLLLDASADLQELIEGLKLYLMGLKLQELEGEGLGILPQKYLIQFEREKIDYLMALDRAIKGELEWLNLREWDSMRVLITALHYYNCLQEAVELCPNPVEGGYHREAIAIAHGLWGINLKELPVDNCRLKDWGFINSMGDYIVRIRDYEIDKKAYENTRFLDAFQLPVGQTLKHPILNHIRVVGKEERGPYTIVEIAGKTGSYTFVK